jgi:hypothetical protein
MSNVIELHVKIVTRNPCAKGLLTAFLAREEPQPKTVQSFFDVTSFVSA